MIRLRASAPMKSAVNSLRTQSLPVSLSRSKPFEEELTRNVPLKYYYPLRLGEVLNNRYQVATKLGWGGRSTVWLAKDLTGRQSGIHPYVAIKIAVATTNERDRDVFSSENKILDHITQENPASDGYNHVSHLLDVFDLPGPLGKHLCMVFEPLKQSIAEFGKHFDGDLMPSHILALYTKALLRGLDYLHTECHVIHTDLKPENVMIAVDEDEQDDLLSRVADYAAKNPLPQKQLEDRTIYQSLDNISALSDHGLGRPIITDFDLAMRGDTGQVWTHMIQPDGYQAPEVLLGAPWSYSTDIWNLGVMLCSLLEGLGIFDARRGINPTETTAIRMGCMIACLGSPPDELLDRGIERGGAVGTYFNMRGTFKRPDLVDYGLTLDSFFLNVEGEEKKLFVNFIERMLKWLPEERSTAQELLTDPWIVTADARSQLS